MVSKLASSVYFQINLDCSDCSHIVFNVQLQIFLWFVILLWCYDMMDIAVYQLPLILTGLLCVAW